MPCLAPPLVELQIEPRGLYNDSKRNKPHPIRVVGKVGDNDVLSLLAANPVVTELLELVLLDRRSIGLGAPGKLVVEHALVVVSPAQAAELDVAQRVLLQDLSRLDAHEFDSAPVGALLANNVS